MIHVAILAMGLSAQLLANGCTGNCGTAQQSIVATGDSRTVNEPTFPAICSSVAATKYIISTNTINVDPYNSTCGSTGGTLGTLGCTGGTDYQPSSTTPSFTSSETLDNTAVQNALNACTSGKAVELVPGASGQRAFVLAPWSLPTGVSIVIDAGIHVFASRNLSDYGGTNCGVVTTGSSSCNHWITSPSTTGSGIYGYGVLDGRGWDAYIGGGGSFYGNRIQAYCNARGGASHGSPACTPGTGNNSYGPNGINLVGTNSFTMYKVTLKDSGNFLVNWSGGNGFTAWDAKLISPFEVSNTDGWDPEGSTNGTFTHGYISNGDNHMAIKATSAAASNITFSNSQTGSGVALAIGSATQNGVSNVLVTNNVQNGNLFNDQAAGIQIASSGANGGLVNQVTYQNDCMMNENDSIRIYTNYGGGSGPNTPIYQNVLLRNINVLGSTAPYTTGNSGHFTFQGLSGNPLGVQIDNLQIQGTNQGVSSQNGVVLDQYGSMFTGPTVSLPSSVSTQFSAGTSVTTFGSASSGTAYPCTTSSWSPLVGELNVKTSTANNNQSYNNTGGATYTLQAVLEPTTEVSTKEQPALSQPIVFLDNGTPVGTVSRIGDGGYAFLNVAGAPAGSHTYTASYSGDSNYPTYTFGNVTVVNPANATYYISPSGNDSNTGNSVGSPWLTPNHALNCGDVILAAAGTYSGSNFSQSHWGTVTCPSNNNVAWLKCATFDTCKINSTADFAGVWIDKSYWGIQGWEVSVGSPAIETSCFQASPNTVTLASIHHIIFANNIANGCEAAGIGAFNQNTTASVDYLIIAGNIAYNGARGTNQCGSGISIYQPIAADTVAGTHIFISGNFSYGNFDPATCAGGASTDGEGIIVDTPDFSQGGGTPYVQQIVVDNNIVADNGSFGIQVFNNSAGVSGHAPVYFRNNTAWGDLQDPNQSKTGAGEITVIVASNTNLSGNIAQATAATGLGGHTLYGLSISGGDASDTIAGNWATGFSGSNNTFLFSSSGFAYGSNTLGSSPAFTAPANPSAPSCGSFGSVPACMAAVISNFTPTAGGSGTFGYHTPGAAGYDALYPNWLCSVTGFPAGLVRNGC